MRCARRERGARAIEVDGFRHLSALNYAIDNNVGDVISMSFGENESARTPLRQPAITPRLCGHAKSITLFASSGDQSGAATCDGRPDAGFLAGGRSARVRRRRHYADRQRLFCDANHICSGVARIRVIAWNELFCANSA
jgi:hypothetical protein